MLNRFLPIVLTIGIAVVAVTTGAIATVVGLPIGGVPGHIAYVALHGLDYHRRLWPHVGRILSRNRNPNRQNQTENSGATID